MTIRRRRHDHRSMVTCELCGCENPDDASVCLACGNEDSSGVGWRSAGPSRARTRVFRLLVVTSLTAYLAVVALDQSSEVLFRAGVISESMRNALLWRGTDGVFWLPPMFYWLKVFLYAAAAVGLCRFSWPSRLVFTVVIVLTYLLLLPFGLFVETPVGFFLWTVSMNLNGAILAMAWTHPLKGRFTRL